MEQSPETIRNEESITDLVNTAVNEAVELFEDLLTREEKAALLAILAEKSTTPSGRVSYLRQQAKAAGKSSKVKEVVNSILLTLRQQLNAFEKQILLGGIQTQMLDDIE